MKIGCWISKVICCLQARWWHLLAQSEQIQERWISRGFPPTWVFLEEKKAWGRQGLSGRNLLGVWLHMSEWFFYLHTSWRPLAVPRTNYLSTFTPPAPSSLCHPCLCMKGYDLGFHSFLERYPYWIFCDELLEHEPSTTTSPTNRGCGVWLEGGKVRGNV